MGSTNAAGRAGPAGPGRGPRPARPRTLLAVLCFATLTWALGQTAIFPALPEIGRELDAGQGAVAWTISGFMVAAAICTPLGGRLGDLLGLRNVLLGSLLIAVGGSVLSAAGTSLEVVVAGRVVQGVGAGVFPLSFAIARTHLPPHRVATAVGLISALVGAGGGIGLVLGGLLADQGSFRMIFWGMAALGVLVCAAVRFLVPEPAAARRGRIDVRGAVVFSVGLLLPLVAIARANTWGWGSPATVSLQVTGIAILTYWWFLQRRTPEPLADTTALASRPVLVTNAVTLLIGFGVYGSFVLMPQLAQTPESTGYGLGLSATGAALVLLPGSLLMLVLGPLSGRLGARWGNRVPLALGGAVASLGLALCAVAHDSVATLTAFGTLMYAGVGLSFAAMPNAILETMAPERAGEGAGFNALVRLVGAALGAQLVAAVLAASAGASSWPSEAGYRTALAISAVASAIAATLAVFIPHVRGATEAAPAHAAHAALCESTGSVLATSAPPGPTGLRSGGELGSTEVRPPS